MKTLTHDRPKPQSTLVHVLLLLAVSFVVFQLGVVATERVETTAFGINFSGDPSSLAELKGLGGGTERNLTTDQMISRSSSVVEVNVVDVTRSYLNTVDGAFPTEDELKAGAIKDLLVLTDVEVEVVRNRSRSSLPTKGKGSDWTFSRDRSAVDESMLVTVMGGAIQTRLTYEQATALGVTEVTETFADRTHHSTDHPDIEIERPVSGPVEDFSFGISPSVSLSEGDNLILVLEEVEVPMIDGSTKRVLSLAHSSSVLHADDAGEWRVGTASGPLLTPGKSLQSLTDILD